MRTNTESNRLEKIAKREAEYCKKTGISIERFRRVKSMAGYFIANMVLQESLKTK